MLEQIGDDFFVATHKTGNLHDRMPTHMEG